MTTKTGIRSEIILSSNENNLNNLSFLIFSASDNSSGFNKEQSISAINIFSNYIKRHSPLMSKYINDLLSINDSKTLNKIHSLISDTFGNEYLADIVVWGRAIKDNDDETIEYGDNYYSFAIGVSVDSDNNLNYGTFFSSDGYIFDDDFYLEAKPFIMNLLMNDE